MSSKAFQNATKLYGIGVPDQDGAVQSTESNGIKLGVRLNHFVDWSVDSSSREQYDSFLLKRNYEGVANTNS